MQQVWLNKNNNSRCILFFNGWGMDANAVCKLAAGHYDVCMFYGYDDMTLADETFETYTDIVLIACRWAYGQLHKCCPRWVYEYIKPLH